MTDMPGGQAAEDQAAEDQAADDQAALHRVATLVIRGAEPRIVLAAVTEEVAAIFDAGVAVIVRCEPNGEQTVLSGYGLSRLEPGARVACRPRRATSAPASHDGHAARVGTDAQPGLTEVMSAEGARYSASAPILVEGRAWGLVGVGSRRGRLPSGAGRRLASFTELAASAVASAQARSQLRGFAEEQAALRRVATLVAQGASPEDVFAAVNDEAGQLLGGDYTILSRYDPDGMVTLLGAWARTHPRMPLSIGLRVPRGGRNIHELVFETGQPARLNDYQAATGAFADAASDWEYRAAVGAPIRVDGRIWGVMVVGSRSEPLSASTEAHLADFTELAATAITNAQAREKLHAFAQEQAGLRRVATLVARSVPPAELFAAVTEEAGRLLGADVSGVSRYEPDGTHTIVGTWASSGPAVPILVGTRFALGGHNTGTLVFQTGQPTRIDDFSKATGPIVRTARQELGASAAVGVPIRAGGRLWGIASVMSRRGPLPADTEERLSRFTELTANAIANAEARAALTASRARIVAAADASRQRIERDLRDGAQQRLASLAQQLREMRAAALEAGELVRLLEAAIAEADGSLEQLREISRGLHPSALANGGLRQALLALASRSAIQVRLEVRVPERLPEPAELTTYYAVSEALTNTAKHARASAAEVRVAADHGLLRICVRDDGRGGADFTRGSGLTGLRDRVEAAGGRISLRSEPGRGTAVEITLPVQAP